MDYKEIEKIKDNINTVNNLLKEIELLLNQYGNLEQNNKQLKIINESIRQFERSNVKVPKELRELKTQLITEVSNKDEVLRLKKDLIDNLLTFINNNEITKSGKINLTRKESDKVPQTVIQTIEVVTYMWDHNYTVGKACKAVAKSRGITENSVRSNCTRNLNLSTDEFRKLVDNKNALITHLNKLFPKHTAYITQNLN
jgi:hypothetical protein